MLFPSKVTMLFKNFIPPPFILAELFLNVLSPVTFTVLLTAWIAPPILAELSIKVLYSVRFRVLFTAKIPPPYLLAELSLNVLFPAKTKVQLFV